LFFLVTARALRRASLVPLHNPAFYDSLSHHQ
jgi:hypothetical protein